MTENCPYCLQELPDPNKFGLMKAFPEVKTVILGNEEYKLSEIQTKMMVLFIEKFNQPVTAIELQDYIYNNSPMRKIQTVWMHIRYLTDKLQGTGYKIDHVCTSAWRLCIDEAVRQSNRDSSAA